MKRNAAEIAKTIAVCVLLVSLVCLCTVYLFSFEKHSSPQFTKSMLAALVMRSSKNVYSEEFAPSLVTPYFIGVNVDGERRGMFTDSDNSSISTLYMQIAEYFPSLFAKGKTSVVSPDDGRRIFDAALDGDSIYISFFCELPKSIIYYMTFPQSVAEDVSNEYLSELAIFPSGTPTRITDTDIYGQPITLELYSFSAIGRNDAGEYFLYSSDVVPMSLSDVYFGKSRISAYNMTGAVRFDFASNIPEYAEAPLSSTTVVTNDLACPGATFTFSIANISDKISYAVNAFGLHYEKAARYMDYDSSISFLEEGHNVRVTKDGVLFYNVTGSSGGVPMDALGVNIDTTYSVSDYVFASLKLIRAMDNDAGDLRLKLNGIYSDGENVVVTFGYCCFNLAVANGEETELFRFEFNSGKLIKAKATLLSSVGGQKSENVPQSWDLNVFVGSTDKKCDFRPVYVCDGGDDVVYAGWRAFSMGEGADE